MPDLWYGPKVLEMLTMAKRDIRRMIEAKKVRPLRKSYIDFLEHSNRAINRLEAIARKEGFHAAYRQLTTKTIWTDPVASYMRQARNVHEHGIEPLELNDRFMRREIWPNGTITQPPLMMVKDSNGEHHFRSPRHIGSSYGEVRPTIYEFETLRLLPVFNHKTGQMFSPPLGGALDKPDEHEPTHAAKLYLNWIFARLEDLGNEVIALRQD